MIFGASIALAYVETERQDMIANYAGVSTSRFIARIVYAQGKSQPDNLVGNAVIQILTDLAHQIVDAGRGTFDTS